MQLKFQHFSHTKADTLTKDLRKFLGNANKRIGSIDLMSSLCVEMVEDGYVEKIRAREKRNYAARLEYETDRGAFNSQIIFCVKKGMFVDGKKRINSFGFAGKDLTEVPLVVLKDYDDWKATKPGQPLSTRLRILSKGKFFVLAATANGAQFHKNNFYSDQYYKDADLEALKLIHEEDGLLILSKFAEPTERQFTDKGVWGALITVAVMFPNDIEKIFHGILDRNIPRDRFHYTRNQYNWIMAIRLALHKVDAMCVCRPRKDMRKLLAKAQTLKARVVMEGVLGYKGKRRNKNSKPNNKKIDLPSKIADVDPDEEMPITPEEEDACLRKIPKSKRPWRK